MMIKIGIVNQCLLVEKRELQRPSPAPTLGQGQVIKSPFCTTLSVYSLGTCSSFTLNTQLQPEAITPSQPKAILSCNKLTLEYQLKRSRTLVQSIDREVRAFPGVLSKHLLGRFC